MTLKRALLLMLLGTSSLSLFAQNGGRSPISVTAIGHMAVTLLSPAALTASQNLEFNDIQLRASKSNEASVDFDMTMAAVRVSGTQATYAVTVSERDLGFNENGNRFTIGNFSAVSAPEETGASSIFIGATMSIAKRNVALMTETNNPLAITINYN